MAQEESGIVGLNPSKAQNDIKSINSSVSAVQRKLIEIACDYYGELDDEWFSPIAVEFYNETAPLINNLSDEIIGFNSDTISSFCEAYNALASSNGSSKIAIAPGPYTKVDSYGVMQEAKSTGEVGMEKDKVETTTASFISRLKSLKSDLSSVPRYISFFDQTGSLVRSCNTRIDQLSSLVDDAIESIIKEISSAIVSETTKVANAVTEATNSLTGTKA